MFIRRNQKQEYAKLDIGYEQVQLKSQIWRHFKRNRYGVCRCNHCGLLCRQLGHSSNILFMHLSKIHPEQIYGFSAPKKNQEDYMSDLIQTLVIQGYPIDKIISSLHKLLTKHQNKFKQVIYKFLGDLPKARNQLQSIFQHLPIDTDRNTVDKILLQNYPNLSEGTRKTLAQQYFWIYSSDEEIILNFKQNGYNIISEYDQQSVGIMMLVTQSMKKAYYRYGDCLNIDVIDKVYKKRSPHGFAQYSCWFFTGQNENMDNVLFGFAIMSEAIDKNLTFLLMRFFSQMSNIYPISICIPPYMILQQKIKQISPKIKIITNWLHKLKFMKDILQNQIQHESIMKTICECFKTPSKSEFDYLVNRIMSKVSDQDAIIFGIQKNTQNFCIFNIPPMFIGFSIQSQKYLNLEREIRKLFVYQRNLARLFIFVIKLDKKLNRRIFSQMKPQFIAQKQIIPPTIQNFRLSRHIQQRIKHSLNQLVLYKIQVVDPVTIQLAARKNDISRWKVFTVTFQIKYNHWSCNCRFLEHTGVPCAHLIKVLQKYGGDYKFYINSRWYKPILN